jgi:hypothetical protein
MEGNGRVVLSVPYQGNAWWALLGLISISLTFRVILQARRKRNAGLQVDVRSVIGESLFILSFCAVALYQLLTHL